jgi:ADP-heptose:LPS heptosyltransferase
MSWKRRLLETIVWSTAQVSPRLASLPNDPKSILVLRNNDLGDVLIITPLFAALRQRFPNAHIAAAVGTWSTDLLKHNPHINQIIPITAPWYNKFIANQSLSEIGRYLWSSPEIAQIRQQRFTIGIDVLGSQFGSLFMMRASIPYRLGVKGFAWGHSAAQQCVDYNHSEQVGRSALRFAELLGAKDIPAVRPQIFLTEAEKARGQNLWQVIATSLDSGSAQLKRIVISPGAGFPEKAWPLANYIELVKILATQPQFKSLQIVVVGGKGDRQAGAQIAAVAEHVVNLAGELALRETFGLISSSDFVISNSSMVMHVAAAFAIPNLVLLGEYFPSTKQHIAQWGYAQNCWIYGQEAGDRDHIYNPSEVVAILSKLFEQLWVRVG